MPTPVLWLALLGPLASGLGGCAVAAVGAAGTAGGILYTDRGAKGEVKGSVSTAREQAITAFRQMNIAVTGTEMKQSGKEQTLEGRADETDVSVSLTQSTARSTHVEVIAREGALKWNKDYAREILSRIVGQG